MHAYINEACLHCFIYCKSFHFHKDKKGKEIKANKGYHLSLVMSDLANALTSEYSTNFEVNLHFSQRTALRRFWGINN